MNELLTSAQMRAIEAAAIQGGTVTGQELMERAGAGVVAAIDREFPDFAQGGPRVVVLCGPGNNGGDGFVIARLLQGRGWQVGVRLYGDADRLPPDAGANFRRWTALGDVAPLAQDDLPPCDLIVDALFGTGLARPLIPPRDPLAGLQPRPRVVAVDIPSGICADSGRVLEGGVYIPADLTVTFHRLKLGHVLDAGGLACGKVLVCDIGLGDNPAQGEAAREVAVAPKILRKGGREMANKFSFGHLLVLGGSAGQGGAARLAARGALRIGAGLVTIGCPPAALAENAARLDAIMLRPVPDSAALSSMLQDPRITALCLGPALSLGLRERDMVATALAARRATVLDADALTLIGQDDALFAALHDRCVLTPHGGEFARLFPDIAERLAAGATAGPAFSKLDAARDAAARAGCTILFKGADTVIAAPHGPVLVNAAVRERAAPWLATAGAGDVLAGFIAGLLARGMDAQTAAATGAWLHVEAARRFGPGLIAEDLPETLPAVLCDLLAQNT
ncbi:NAD(P)H-hydrate dehydratase [Halodurantibacterium flavum]|uniref:Bifunctional NAD(P)H-hydrate repair enzyme n=1 Tax=Halodurantibacterium flavum TaxID=1382802 RepID=A0ABW4SC08_9RHOB